MTKQSKGEGGSPLLRKVAALLEVLGVFIVGQFVCGCLLGWMGVDLGALISSASKLVEPDFIPLTVAFFKILVVQYACLLPLAFGIGWWRRRLNLRHYGVTRAGQPVWPMVATGLIAFALVGMPLRLLQIARQFFPLGQASPFLVLMEKSWTPSFWLLMAVASFALVPVLEELFYRGYCQTRLEEDFGGMGAMVIIGLFMTLAHSQYHHLSVMSLGTILGLIPMMLGMGFVYWHTRSLIPGMVLHAAINFPTKGVYDFLLLAAMVLVLILFRERWLGLMRSFQQAWLEKGWKRAAFTAAPPAVALVIGYEYWPDIFVPVGFIILVAAILLELRMRRSQRSKLQLKEG